MDCTVEKKVCALHKVNGFPTVKIFRRGRVEEFNCPRDAQGSWTSGQPPTQRITRFACRVHSAFLCRRSTNFPYSRRSFLFFSGPTTPIEPMPFFVDAVYSANLFSLCCRCACWPGPLLTVLPRSKPLPFTLRCTLGRLR